MNAARSMSPVVIVPAAGAGRRFAGQGPKLAQPVGESTLLGLTLERVVASGLPLLVVTIAELVPIVRQVVAARDILLLPPVGSPSGEPLGLGFTIASAVSARPNAPGWLVHPGDMPLLQASTLIELARALRQFPLAVARCQGKDAYPVGFSSELYTELVRLRGDEGPRRLMARYPAQPVNVDDPDALCNVDTSADLERLRERVAAAKGEAAGC